MQLKTVVLPAPLGPIKLAMESSSTSRLSRFTATKPPKRLVRLRIERMAAMLGSAIWRLFCDEGGFLFPPHAARACAAKKAAALRGERPSWPPAALRRRPRDIRLRCAGSQAVRSAQLRR